MPDRSRKRPRDPNELAHAVVGLATGDLDEEAPKDAARKAAGSRGGRRRAEELSAEKRSAIARRAAQARWKKPQPE